MGSSLQRRTVGLLVQRAAVWLLQQLTVLSTRGPQRGEQVQLCFCASSQIYCTINLTLCAIPHCCYKYTHTHTQRPFLVWIFFHLVTVLQGLRMLNLGGLTQARSQHHLAPLHRHTVARLWSPTGAASSLLSSRREADRGGGDAPSALHSAGSVIQNAAGPAVRPVSLGWRVTAVSLQVLSINWDSF